MATVKKKATKRRSVRSAKKRRASRRWYQQPLFIIASIAVALTIFGITFQRKDSSLADAAPCPRVNTSVAVRYPVSGYFMYTTSDQCKTRTSLESMHTIGADTAITFGSSLKPTSAKNLKKDSIYRHFSQKGKHGYDIARSATSGGRIANVYTYSDKIGFGSAAHSCKGRSGTITNNRGLFNWFIVPTDAGYSACTSPSRTYDLIVTNSRSTQDANTHLVNEAARYGMKVYLGLPKVHNHNASYSHTYGSFVTRVVKSWQQLYGKKASFAGVYQTDEIFLGTKMSKSTLKLYDIQHKIVSYHLKGDNRVILISPYTSLLRSSGNTLNAVTESAKKVVGTSNGVKMIMAPQDGGGTGRVGVYDSFEKKYNVRTAVRQGLGVKGTNEKVFIGDTQEFLRAVKRGIGSRELWGNIEAFGPGGSVGYRPRTTRAELDKQVRRAAPATSKLIAYRWNDYMTDTNKKTKTSLYRSIYTNGSKPQLASVSRIDGGIQIVGYKLRHNKTVQVTVTSEGKTRVIKVSPSSFSTHLKGRMDVRRIAVPGLKKGKPVYVQVNNGLQRTNTLGVFY